MNKREEILVLIARLLFTIIAIVAIFVIAKGASTIKSERHGNTMHTYQLQWTPFHICVIEVDYPIENY